MAALTPPKDLANVDTATSLVSNGKKMLLRSGVKIVTRPPTINNTERQKMNILNIIIRHLAYT